MPAATPLPRGPSVLTLYTAADLLTAPGCPVCRYTTEASDRYLTWFALEGHAQPATITRLCASLGTCALHTRRLMGQPGAAVRLTAVYRYVVTAARDRLAGRTARLAACPACEHDDAAAGRALDTLLEGFADASVLRKCRDLGGLCLPHLGAAAAARRSRAVAWLAGTMQQTIAAGGTRLDWLAGADGDAGTRAARRRAVPVTGASVLVSCMPCRSGARAERDALQRLPGAADDGPDPALALCAGHLADAATATSGAGLRSLLAWQARCLSRRRKPGPAQRARAGLRRQDAAGKCPVCRERRDAVRRALACFCGTRAVPPAGSALCVRHHLILRAADPRVGRLLALPAVQAADQLIGELAEAFDRAARARSHGGRVPESAAWRRAAAFLDGGVFGGYWRPPGAGSPGT